MVAGSVLGHEHYHRAKPVLKLAEKCPGDFFCASHSLAETYNTLTRLPFQPRIHPADALRIIRETIIPHFKMVTLDAKAYVKVLSQCAEDGLVGGVIYDALLLHCAATVKPDRIYTFNLRDFQRISPGLASKIMAP